MGRVHELLSKRLLELTKQVKTPKGEEGKDYIAVYAQSKSELGKMLGLYYNSPFTTPVGKFLSMITFSNFLKYENLPKRYYLNYLDSLEVRKQGLKKSYVYNYWSAMGTALYYKIVTTPKLKELLKENTLPFGVHKVKRKVVMLGTEVEIDKEYKELLPYIVIINKFQELLKADNLNEATAREFLEEIRSNPERGIMEKEPLYKDEAGKNEEDEEVVGCEAQDTIVSSSEDEEKS